jgi:phosphohistidine phosphatase
VRTLLLLRHAKSSWDDPTLADRDRPLAPRGIKAATLIAEYLRAERMTPELVLCSPARRTRETVGLLQPALDKDTEVRIDERLYGAGVGELLETVRGVDDSIGSVLVVGHNPGLHDATAALAGAGGDDAEAMEQLRTKFPTAALAILEVMTGWAQLAAGQARLAGVVLPRRLA